MMEKETQQEQKKIQHIFLVLYHVWGLVIIIINLMK
jgi:hypothetical protein